jgi:rod shape-determining protein MreD
VTLLSWSRVVAVTVIGFLFQVTVLDQIVVLGAHPDVMIVLVGAAGAAAGPARGAMIGFVLGLAADLAVTTPYGLSALTFVLIGFAAGLIEALPGERTFAMQVVTTIAASAIGTLAYALLGALTGQSSFLSSAAVYAMLVVTVGAFVLAPPAVALMRWIAKVADRVATGKVVPSGGSALR